MHLTLELIIHNNLNYLMSVILFINSCFAGENIVLDTIDTKKGQKNISLQGQQGKLGFRVRVKLRLDLILNKCFFYWKMKINPA